VLKGLDLLLKRRQVRYVSESLLEETGRADECCRLLLEELVKASLAWDERPFYGVSQNLSEAAGSVKGR
jgi:hypothetical protein